MRVSPVLLLALLVHISSWGGGFHALAEESDAAALSEREVRAGRALMSERKYAEALERFRAAMKLDPFNVGAYLGAGNVMERLGRHEEAIEAYRKAIALDPHEYKAYLSIWQTRLRDAQDDEKEKVKGIVAEEVKGLMEKGPESDELCAAAFFAYDLVGDEVKRDDAKRALVREYPDSEEIDEVAETSFEIILRKGDIKDRVGPALQFVKDFPRNKLCNMAYRIALKYYYDRDEKDRVREICDEWVRVRPSDRTALYISSRIFTEKDIDVGCAAKWAEKAVDILMKEARESHAPWYYEGQYRDEIRLFEALDALGYALLAQGNLDEAEEYIKRSLEEFGFNERALFHLGKFLEAKGDKDGAIEAYVESLICREDTKDAMDALMPLVSEKCGGEPAEAVHAEFARERGEVYFCNVTEDAGLGGAGGGRVAWGDFDGDGFQDLLLSGSHLWRNRGDGSFEDVTEKAGICGGFGGGVWADFNNDGRLDFFSAGAGDALWRNNGDGTFANVTEEMGGLSDGCPSEGAAWGDYDRDGFVDLYVANYEKPGPELAIGTPDILWKNEKGESFKNVTNSVGMAIDEPLCGRGVSWGDYNNDGWLDIFVSNYRLDPDLLWRNGGDGTFTNVAKEAGVEGVCVEGWYGHTIGSDWGDYDNDGDLDLFQANLAHPRYIEFSNMSYLLENSGEPDFEFEERRAGAGIRYEETHSDPAWCDYNNDGCPDLYVTSVYPERPSFLYRAGADGGFTDVTWLAGVRVMNGWGCAWADYDNDGDMDLAVCAGGVKLFRNELYSLRAQGGSSPHWLEVRLVGSDCNRAAIGARVTVIADGKRFLREVQGGKGTTTQSSLVAHFGLGESSNPAMVEIRWPCGRVQVEKGVTVGQAILIRERGDGE